MSAQLWRALLLVALVPLGLATKSYAGPGADWVQAHLGGTAYVMFWIVLLGVVRPSARPLSVALAVALLTSGVEALQLVSAPALDVIRSTPVGRVLLGRTFSWWDFPYYGLGALLGWLALAVSRPRESEVP